MKFKQTENAQFADVKRIAIPFENLRANFAQAELKVSHLNIW